jgi:hypothetical protein
MKLGDVVITFQIAFPLNVNISDPECFCENNLGKSFPYARKDQELIDEVDKVSSFLATNDATKNALRIELDKLKIHILVGNQIVCVPVHVALSHYRLANIAILMMNMTITECVTDDVISIRHSLYHDPQFDFEYGIDKKGDFKHKKKCNILDMMNCYIKSILEACENSVEHSLKACHKGIVIELRDVHGVETVEEIVVNHTRELYGLLSCDEGYRKIAKVTAEKALSITWASRDFLSIFAFSECVIEINLVKSDLYEDYITEQMAFFKHYFGSVPSYYRRYLPLRNNNHPRIYSRRIFIVENVLVMRVVLDVTKAQMIALRHTSSIQELRKIVMNTLKILPDLEANELDKQRKCVLQATGVLSIVEDVRRSLDTAETELMILHQEQVNYWMIGIATISAIAAFMAVFISIYVYMTS